MTTTPSSPDPAQRPGTSGAATGGGTTAPGTGAPTQSPTGPATPTGPSSLDGLLNTAKSAATRARDLVGKLAHDNRSRIDAALNKAGAAVDQRTGGKYAGRIESTKRQLERGLDVLEGAPSRPGAASPNSPTGPTSGPTGGPAGPRAASPTRTPTGGAAGPAPATPTPAAPGRPATPSVTPPAEPKEGWHRGPNGEWVRSDS